jgi:hypothetical protein
MRPDDLFGYRANPVAVITQDARNAPLFLWGEGRDEGGQKNDSISIQHVWHALKPLCP